MIQFFITYKYIAKITVLLAAISLLSGCLGGTIAQQIARSIATHVADKMTARAMDVDENDDYSQAQYTSAANISTQNNALQRNALQGNATQNTILANNASGHNQRQNSALQNTPVDPYKIAFVNAAFEPVQAIAEPLPAQTADIETPIQSAMSNQLVRVELFNLLIGDEKAAVYEKARILGSASLPKAREWDNWRVATGAVKSADVADKKLITFLIPPEFGKLPSGTIAVVELASTGELNIARYMAN